jgi:hypothetical protein
LVRHGLLAILIVIVLPANSYAGGKLSWGSRIAMEVTVQAMSGLDTEHAVIRTKLTREDAIAYCREHEGGATRKCIANKLSEPISDEITANCKTGEFSDFFGRKYKFLGNNRDPERMAQYLLKDLGSGEVADGSSASGYPTNMALFAALCPGTAPRD